MKKVLLATVASMFLVACSNADDLSTYEEYGVLEETIDVAQYEPKVETDNDGNRVILFYEDERVAYKSVYVKNERHLKVISTGAEAPLYNDTL
ncbi:MULTISPECIES: hypothetical protein [unclassified Exiguobacterium]|uniref:hypothetical protein n=1 Tax=unclassified Exiguobacterium TaxID=2644629 RepID=UPI00103F7271|nr:MULTISPECIES: hypothetical protein [unclassified Exiguobacterium]TCI43094.1 hypothetical protein EVJ31_13110 [Exiguobacterium sp. SH5S32]TCI49879.1 hypothetical protein EVJ25_13615 [Exiguobacterium sp. SH1S4]TCI68115.1 hypothetical protein EVJ23_13100 [Exiguobacterium sp. SH1S1]